MVKLDIRRGWKQPCGTCGAMGRVLYIGIDELSRRKGHVYVTNVYDLEQKRLLWSGPGRSQETLRAFFKEHGAALRDGIQGVCCDMWQPYIDMIKEQLPHAVLIYDRFHKESFREFWDYTVKSKARDFLQKWFWWATHSRLKPIRDFAWTIKRHKEDILNYFDLPISNGAVEGLNNKTKLISHRCYGFRTAANYITALYHCLGKLPEPILVHRFA